jgi:dTDP-4-dehydrorhamnose reductase
MPKLLVTGIHGQIAQSLVRQARFHSGIAVEAIGRPEVDLEKPETIATAIAARAPDIIVNAAAYTAVDKAGREPALAYAVNRDGAAAVAEAARRLGVPLIHLSTDYVYDGRKPSPYVEGDATGPLGVYGASKLAGEHAVLAACPPALILRTSWVYSPFGSNFVKTMLRIGGERGHVQVVDDQTGNPTSADDLADAIQRIAPRLGGRGGVYHLAGSGHVSWCGFARHIFATSGKLGGPMPMVEAIATKDHPTQALRPQRSWLATDAFAERFGFTLPDWRDSVDKVVGELLKEKP